MTTAIAYGAAAKQVTGIAVPEWLRQFVELSVVLGIAFMMSYVIVSAAFSVAISPQSLGPSFSNRWSGSGTVTASYAPNTLETSGTFAPLSIGVAAEIAKDRR